MSEWPGCDVWNARGTDVGGSVVEVQARSRIYCCQVGKASLAEFYHLFIHLWRDALPVTR